MKEWESRLIEGYLAFRAGEYPDQKDLYAELGNGQSPKMMVISCADSRVGPADIFNAYPGDLFVARNVANIVPPFNADQTYHATTAAIEYAVTALKVEAIVVMGHEACGGVGGCLAGMGDDPQGSFVGSWVSLLNAARDRVVANTPNEADRQHALELEGVRQSLSNLMTFPFVKSAVDAGELSLCGAFFGIGNAELKIANADGVFETIKS